MSVNMLAQWAPDHGITPESSDWDAETFFTNGTNYMQNLGGAFLAFIGLCGVVWGGFLLLRKLMGNQQNQDSWFKIVALILVGGAMIFGGINLLINFGYGGKETVENFGTAGAVIMGSHFGYLPDMSLFGGGGGA